MLRTLLPYVVALCVVAVLVTPSRADEAYIFNLRDWEGTQGDYSTDCADSIYHRCHTAKWKCWATYDSTNVVEFTQSQATTEPEVTLDDWRDNMPYATDLDLITHGRSDGAVMAEVHQTMESLQLAFSAYINSGVYFASEIDGAIYTPDLPEAYAIVFLKEGISSHLSVLADDALVVANFCHSCESATCWGLDLFPDGDGGAILCQHAATPGWIGCDDLNIVMKVLGCEMHPTYRATAGDADRATPDTEMFGDPANQYSYDEDCNNPAAAFDGVFAFDGKVVFRTVYEAGSICLFVMGVDSWSEVGVGDWKSWDVLARVKPEGGRGIAQLYEVDGVPDKAAYRIVEVDRYGRPTFSPTFVRGARPAEYEEWLAHPAIVAAADGGLRTPSRLYRWEPDRRVSHDSDFASPRDEGYMGRTDGSAREGSRADSSGCADIVAYTNADYDSLFSPVWNHLSNYPSKKVMYFAGSSSLDDARACYASVYANNWTYNYASGTERFPTDNPGPLLLIVGDSRPSEVVEHGGFPDEYDRCLLPCYSDRDATNLGSGPIGLVHRIPANTVAEVERACAGADDWNRGDHVDPHWSAIEVVGNRLGDSTTEWPIEMADAAVSEFLGMGCLAKPPLVDGDYPLSVQGTLDKWADFDAQLDDGAAMLWGFGRLTDALYELSGWPGHFVHRPDTTANRTQQRIVAMMPSCTTVGVWRDNIHVTSLVEQWMYFDPRFTQIVGTVGHLTGAWEHQHLKAEDLYMDAWAEAPHDVPLDWIVWRAAQMASEQELDWMTDYFRSAATMGAYVLTYPGDSSYTSVPDQTDGLPATWSLRQNAPNPFNPNTVLHYVVPAPGGHVRVAIFDAAGRCVATLVDANSAPGLFETSWSGRNDAGEAVSSGVYFCRMEAAGFSESCKLVLVK